MIEIFKILKYSAIWLNIFGVINLISPVLSYLRPSFAYRYLYTESFSINRFSIKQPLLAKSPKNPGSDFTGDEDFEDEFDGEKAVPSIGSKSNTENFETDFNTETEGVGDAVYVQLVPMIENLITKMV